MNNKHCGWRVFLATLALSATGAAKADWLAADPGTPISLVLTKSGTLVVRPLGGTWSHPLCEDVTAAEFPYHYANNERPYALGTEMLIAAAANGSLVNLFAEPDECDDHGHPVIRNVRIQAP